MPALLEAWPGSPTSIGQNAGQDNGSDAQPAWTGLFLQHRRRLFCRLSPIRCPFSILFSDYYQTHGGWGRIGSDLTFLGFDS